MKQRKTRNCLLVAAVSLTDVDKRQHHENECLQQNNQQMEKPPNQTGGDLPKPSANSPNRAELKSKTTQQGDQEEDQLAGIHVAEESHPQRHEFGSVLDDVQQEVEGPKSGMLAKRSRKQFNHKPSTFCKQ